jgi:hypothetical protein
VCLQHFLQEAKKNNQNIPDNMLNMLRDLQMVSGLTQLQPSPNKYPRISAHNQAAGKGLQQQAPPCVEQ